MRNKMRNKMSDKHDKHDKHNKDEHTRDTAKVR